MSATDPNTGERVDLRRGHLGFIGDRYGFPFIAVLPGGKYLSQTEFKELMAVLGIDENCARLSPANPTCNTDGFIEEEPFPSMPK